MKNSVRLQLLSYVLDEKTRGYGNVKTISINPVKELQKGDSCNTSALRLSAHAGTHIDAPRHFFNTGKAITDYSIDDFIFRQPQLIECPKAAGEFIVLRDLLKLHRELKRSDILLLRTGFFRFRKEKSYYLNNPGIVPGVAEFIWQKFPKIRCVGIDTISISPYRKRSLGRQTHKIFLKAKPPILVIEDMDLSASPEVLKKIRFILVPPFFIKGIEASPCSVIGFM